MNDQELREYINVMIDNLNTDFVRTFLKPRLESYFYDPDEPNRLEVFKQTAKDCVRIKNDVDKRMKDYREAKNK